MKNKWKIISPEGKEWEGISAIRCCANAIRGEKTDAERINNLINALALGEPFPWKTRSGMKVSAEGVLERVAVILEGQPKDFYPRYEFSIREMLKHLKELADRFYVSDDIEAVDEFLQLYDLDKERVEK